MTTDLLLGIDLGTSAVKTALVTAEGDELAHASAPLTWTPVDTGAETTLAELRRLALTAVNDVLAQVPSGQVRGIGVAGMAEAGSALDAEGLPVDPIIAWHDRRGRQEAAQVARDLGPERFSAVTGLPLSATPTIMKLAWQKRHSGAIGRARRWLGVPEALAHSFGAAPVTDLSLACRTGLLDLEHRSWWREAIDWLDLPDLDFGEPVPSGTALGTVDAAAGLPARLHGAVLTVAGHDHLVAAFGAGATKGGDVFDSCGTAEALLCATRPLSPRDVARAVADGLCVSWHVVPGLQVLIATAPTGLFLRTVLEQLGCAEPAARNALEQAARRLPDSATLHLTGLDTAHVVAAVENGSRPELVWRAAIDTATSESADLMTTIRQYAGSFERLIATGGWTRSELYLTAKLQRFGPTAAPQVTEACARGAALMAGVASGLYCAVDDAPPPTYTVLTGAAAGGSDLTPPRHQPYLCVPGSKEVP